MDSVDTFRERFEDLERKTEQLQQHTNALEAPTRTVERRLRWWRGLWRAAVVVTLGLSLALPLPVQAKTFHCGAGDVQCLIDAINAANANGTKNTIRLEAGTYTLTAVDNGSFDTANGLPVITSPLTITGEEAESTIIERAATAPAFRLLEVAATSTLKRLTLRGGDGGNLDGAGIRNRGHLTLIESIVADSRFGSGLSNTGTL